MIKTTFSLLSAVLAVGMATSAQAVVILDDDISVSFSFHIFGDIINQTFSDGFTGPSDDPAYLNNGPTFLDGRTNWEDTFGWAAGGGTNRAFSGTRSLVLDSSDPLHSFGGHNRIIEEQLGGAGDATAAERNMSNFDAHGKVELSLWYNVQAPIGLNSDGDPLNDINSPIDILPMDAISLRFFDSDHSTDPVTGDVVAANVDITSVGSFDMIADGEWRKASVILDVLDPAARAALDGMFNGVDEDQDVASVLFMQSNITAGGLQVPNPLNPPDFLGAGYHFYIDQVEINAIPEPASLLLVLAGCTMIAARRNRG